MAVNKSKIVNKSRRIHETLKSRKLIALLAPRAAEHCLAAYEILEPLGVTLEVAFRTEAAADGLGLVLDRHPEALVLAGTVMSADQARRAIAEGAAGIVSADYIPSVVEVCARADVMAVPGGLNDCGKQLAQKAEIYGCDLVELRVAHPHQWVYKLFPAATRSLTLVELASAWRGPFPDLTVIHTGGVTIDNLARLAAADPAGIFCGSALTARLDHPAEMAEEVRRWIAVVRPEEGNKPGSPRPV